MRKSLSKKILAMFLAVLMLVTAIPLTSLAATDGDLTALDAAITEYETKMNGTVYTNMKTAYDAYIKARELKDAYISGQDKSVDLAAATTALKDATAAMGNYVEPTITYTVPAWFDVDDTVRANTKNVLYADANYDRNQSVGTIKWNGDDFINAGIHYGTTVLLYDGVNAPQFPVMCSASGKGSKIIIRRLLCAFPAEEAIADASKMKESADFRLSLSNGNATDDTVWCGGRTNGNNSYTYNYTYDTSGSDASQYIGGSLSKEHWSLNLNNRSYYYASSIKYNNTIKPNEYTLDVQIPWVFKTEYGQAPFYHSFAAGAMNADTHTYVVNYKAVKDAIALANGAGQLSNVGAYNEHWAEMSQLMTAIDTATTFNPNSYDYAADTAAAMQKCNADIKTIVEGIQAGVKIAKDTPSYEKLRNTIELAKDEYAKGNGTPEEPTYTADSWSQFENAYNAAVAEMKGLPTNHYNVAGVADIEAALMNAYKNLTFFKQASFIAYNIAKDELVAKLQQGGWTAKSLEEVNSALANNKYFDPAKQVNVPVTAQPSIDAETEQIKAAEALLQAADNSVFEAMKVSIKTINADSSNVAEVQKEFEKLSATTTRVVTVLGTEYTGSTYDEIVSSVLTKVNETKYDYTVKIVNEATNQVKYVVYDEVAGTTSYTTDETQATKFHYDDKVTVTSAATSYKDAAFDWAVEVIAQSTASQSVRKVVSLNSQSYEFSVRGNTTIYVSAPTASNAHKVTFIDSRTNECVAFAYTTTGTMDIATVGVPDRVYHDIKDYTCETAGVTIEGTTISGITSDITVTVNYQVSPSIGVYSVRFEDAFGAVIETKTVKFNQLVTLTKEGATYFTDKATGKVLWTGDTYSFFACQNITVVAHADEKAIDDVNVSVSSAPIVSNGITRFVGSFAQVPSRYKVLNYGVVIDVDGKYPTDLSLAKVNKNDHVYNMSSSGCDTASNQFIVGIVGANYSNINYAAYVICEDTQTGYRQIFYSDIVHA